MFYASNKETTLTLHLWCKIRYPPLKSTWNHWWGVKLLGFQVNKIFVWFVNESLVHSLKSSVRIYSTTCNCQRRRVEEFLKVTANSSDVCAKHQTSLRLSDLIIFSSVQQQLLYTKFKKKSCFCFVLGFYFKKEEKHLKHVTALLCNVKELF